MCISFRICILYPKNRMVALTTLNEEKVFHGGLLQLACFVTWGPSNNPRAFNVSQLAGYETGKHRSNMSNICIPRQACLPRKGLESVHSKPFYWISESSMTHASSFHGGSQSPSSACAAAAIPWVLHSSPFYMLADFLGLESAKEASKALTVTSHLYRKEVEVQDWSAHC